MNKLGKVVNVTVSIIVGMQFFNRRCSSEYSLEDAVVNGIGVLGSGKKIEN